MAKVLYSVVPKDWSIDIAQQGVMEVFEEGGIGIYKDPKDVYSELADDSKPADMRVVKLTIEFVEH